MPNMEHLPYNVLRHVLLYLPVHQRFNVRRVCRTWDRTMPLNDFKTFKVEWLKLGTSANTKCFTKFKKIEQALRYLLPRCALSLRELDFGSLRMELNDEFVQNLVDSCPNILVLNSQSSQVSVNLISDLENLKELRVGTIQCVSLSENIVDYFNNLDRLEFCELDHKWTNVLLSRLNCQNLIKLKFAKNRHICQDLDKFEQTSFDEFTGKCGNLSHLHLYRPEITSLRNAGSMKSIRHFGVENCLTLNDTSTFVEAADSFKHTLTSLTFSHCPNISNFDFLSILPNLISVNLQASKISGLGVLSSSGHLQDVNLSNCEFLSDCSGLVRGVDRSKLESLNLSGSNVTSFEFLKNLKGIRTLNVEDCDSVKSEDLAHLSENAPLQTLVLRRAHVTDELVQTILSKSFNLQQLYLGAGQVSEELILQTLDQNTELQFLEIACITGYRPVEVLRKLHNLKHLRKIDFNACSSLTVEDVQTFLAERIELITANHHRELLAVGLMQYFEENSTVDLFNLIKSIPGELKRAARVTFV